MMGDESARERRVHSLHRRRRRTTHTNSHANATHKRSELSKYDRTSFHALSPSLDWAMFFVLLLLLCLLRRECCYSSSHTLLLLLLLFSGIFFRSSRIFFSSPPTPNQWSKIFVCCCECGFLIGAAIVAKLPHHTAHAVLPLFGRLAKGWHGAAILR